MNNSIENQTSPGTYLSKDNLLYQIKKNGIIVIILLLLACLGIGITDVSPHYGVRYWIVISILFALVSIFFGFSKYKDKEQDKSKLIFVFSQFLHWIGLLLAIFMVLYLESSGRINSEAAGLVSLLMVALVCFLSGVHGDWRFGLVGILLGLTVGAAAWVEEYLWMLFIPLFIAIVVGVIWFWYRRKSSSYN